MSSSLPIRDHRVSFRSREGIRDIALEWRRAGHILNAGYFDITDFVENVLAKHTFKKGRLTLKFFRGVPDDDPAFVTYKPLTLHVDESVWTLARLGDPDSRHIIAHEIGHIILHDHYARPFSNDPSQWLKSVEDENSAEWQANIFAAYFLAPDHLVRAYVDSNSLAKNCSLPANLAQERKLDVENPKRRSLGYTGEACTNCGNFTLIRTSLTQQCETCGAITTDK
jgi:IrrE N-terminal-like domain